MIGFSRSVQKWMSKITLAEEQRCHEAIEWISRLSADGNTCTLQAIQVIHPTELFRNQYMRTKKTTNKIKYSKCIGMHHMHEENISVKQFKSHFV